MRYEYLRMLAIFTQCKSPIRWWCYTLICTSGSTHDYIRKTAKDSPLAFFLIASSAHPGAHFMATNW